jgi:hypothetical protein
MKLVMQRKTVAQICEIFTKIDIKERGVSKEEENTGRWTNGKGRSASIEKSGAEISKLKTETARLIEKRDRKRGNLKG